MNPGIQTIEQVSGCIRSFRGEQVLLSPDLARLYSVEPKRLVEAVNRNRARFPVDFMFQLDRQEWEDLKSQIVISRLRSIFRNRRYRTSKPTHE